MIISISYHKVLDKEGKDSLKLNSVRNDLKLLLDRHKYGHHATKDTFYIYADYEPEYNSAPLPHREATKKEILDGFAKAISNGGSVVIYYSGHCARRGPGESRRTLPDGSWRFEEDGVACAGPPYLISSQCERIYGEEVYAALSGPTTVECKTTIKMIFDTCHVATFFDKAIKFPCLYRAVESSKASLPKTQSIEKQIIFVTATQFHEVAQTLRLPEDPEKEVGALAFLMKEWFEDREAPRSAQSLVDRLCEVCRGRQTPQIQSLAPIESDFEL